MVQTLLGLAELPSPPDAADAAALALCHLATPRCARPRRGRPTASRGPAVIGSLRGTLLDRWGDGELLIEVGGRRLPGHGHARPRVVELGELGRRGVRARPPPPARRHPGALRLPHPRRARLLREPAGRPRGRARRWRWPSSRCTGPTRCAVVVADDDIDALCLVPGVGKKTAARLLIELKSSLSRPVLDVAAGREPAATERAPVGPRRRARGPGRTSATGPTRWPRWCASCPRPTTCSVLLKEALQRLAVG